MKTINERITLVRNSKYMKQKEFSELINVPRSSLSEIESGKRNANVDVIVGISTHFKDINVDWLLTGEGEMYRTNQGLDSALSDSQTDKIVELYGSLSQDQQKEILSAITEKKRLNQLIETVEKLQTKVG
jgi:transcriptional regulator with XRE-family HTH domain